jgi:predicted PurR-regulated permease PerM
MPAQTRPRTSVDVPWRTLIKIAAFGAFLWAVHQLTSILLVLVVSAMLAVTLDPIVRGLVKRGWSRTAAATLVSAVILVLVGGFLWMTWASLWDQAQYLFQHLGDMRQQAFSRLPSWMRNAAGAATGGNLTDRISTFAVGLAQSASAAAAVMALGFILTIFLLIEGNPTYQWLLAFVPKRHRAKAHRTAEECQEVVFEYWKGNIITSIIATVVTLVALWILGVPAALLLALMAGLSDFVPVIGFVVSSIPAILLALTVSMQTTVIVIIVYIVYNVVETYLISPWAYGNRMKLSNTAVILAFAVGAQLGGVIGALIALPIAAMYPVVERLWLREKLADDTVEEHRAAARKVG